jgi:uncharacterized protein DUF6438
MRNRAQMICLGLFVLAACHREVPPIAFDELTLERTLCYGTCPSYRLTIFADGRVEYEGRKFVKVEGNRTKRIPTSAVAELRVELGKVNYFALRDRYASQLDGCPIVWTDNPSAMTSVRRNGIVKTVHHYYGCREMDWGSTLGAPYPEYLADFEDRVDQIVDSGEWVRVASL